jgi:hypothetical protein
MQWLIKKLRSLRVPIAAYLVITLVLPLLHGAGRRADFFAHARWVVAGCLIVVAVALIVAAVIDVALHLTGDRR